MKISWGSLLLGMLIGAVGTLLGADVVIRSMPTEHLMLTKDLVLCAQGVADCRQHGGLSVGSHIEVDPKGLATLRFWVPPPLVAGSVVPVTDGSRPPPVELRRPYQ
jgi:hypothetical protein